VPNLKAVDGNISSANQPAGSPAQLIAFRNLFFHLSRDTAAEQLDSHTVELQRVDELTVSSAADPAPAPAHSLIEGENLHALTHLVKSRPGAVDCIYIDPPYNTGKAMTFHDSFDADTNNVVGVDHSPWLSFMYRRLLLARDLLTPTGVCAISVDDREQAQLRLLCDGIFGSENFIAQIVWSAPLKGRSRLIAVKHDYVLVYARSKTSLVRTENPWQEEKAGARAALAEAARLKASHGSNAEALFQAWLKTQKTLLPGVKSYRFLDERGPFAKYPLSAPRGGHHFDIAHPGTDKPCSRPARGWSVHPERIAELQAQGRLTFGKDHRSSVYQKYYLSEHMTQDLLAVIYCDRSAAAQQLSDMVGDGRFDFPKDVPTLVRLLSVFCNRSDAVFCDFFAGSGSTGHAVFEMNARDGGSREVILVTNNENDICSQVTLPRLRAALTGVWVSGAQQPLPGVLHYSRVQLIPREQTGSDSTD
jgi:adenine-specific DNA-methyltransferase